MNLAPPAAPRSVRTAKKVRRILWVLIAAVVAAGVVGFAVLAGTKPVATAGAASSGTQLVRDDSHRLTTPAREKAVLVEFLDFECGPCRMAVPLMEDLKKEFGHEVTFVHRHFPLPGHRNAGTAALAVEAAAQQGKYEQMYLKIFDTQPQWAGAEDSQAALFRAFAQDLGLDLARYDAAIDDEKIQDRIRRDIDDGTTLGVTGTPTFFLDGKKLTVSSQAQFRQALESATR
jgi:protein-disulfide isomerase